MNPWDDIDWQDEPDYEAMAEARRDPEADLDRMEDAYERWLDRMEGE